MWVGLNGYELKNIAKYLAKGAAVVAGAALIGYGGFRCCNSHIVSNYTPFEQDTVENMQRDMKSLEHRVADGVKRRTAKSAKSLYESMREGIRDSLD